MTKISVIGIQQEMTFDTPYSSSAFCRKWVLTAKGCHRNSHGNDLGRHRTSTGKALKRHLNVIGIQQERGSNGTYTSSGAKGLTESLLDSFLCEQSNHFSDFSEVPTLFRIDKWRKLT